MLEVSPLTIRDWRVRLVGPAYIKVGRAIRYRPEDIERWMLDNAKDTDEQQIREPIAAG